MSWRDRTRRWFVEYNPLYFASAMCVFAGVWLVAEGLPVDRFASKAAVVAITEAYQVLLIAGAWLLRRAGQQRPAALLGLVALLFVMDVAFNGERLFSHARTLSLEPGMRARVAVPASLLFACLGPVKLALLARVFRLNARAFVAVAGAAVFLLPLLPYVVEGAGARPLAHLFVFWLGAPFLGWALARPGWGTEEVDGLRVRRIARAAPFLVAGLFVVHAATWSTFPGLSLTPAHGAPYALVTFLAWGLRLSGRRAELAAWAGALGGMALATLGPAGVWPPGVLAILTGGALLAFARATGHRLLLPAVVCVYGGAFLLAAGRVPPPVPGPGWMLALCGALTAAAAAHRDVRCLLASGVALGAAVVGLDVLPLGLMIGGCWVAATSWLLFPDQRRWLPCAALAVALAAAAAPLWREPAPTSFWFLGTSLVALGVGLAFRYPAYKLTGGAGLAFLAVALHSSYAPRGPLSWGLLLLAFGFAFLVAGLAVNLRQRPA